MRSPFVALAVILIMSPIQQPTASPPPVQAAAISIRSLSSTERPGQGAVLLAWPGTFYVARPVISVPARALVPGSAAHADRFSARVWHEGSRTYFVVYAVVRDQRAPNGETETPIYTFFITVGQQIEVKETEAWGAEHVVITGMSASELR